MRSKTGRPVKGAMLIAMGMMLPLIHTLGVPRQATASPVMAPPVLPVIPLATRSPRGAILLFTGKQEQITANWYQRYSKNPARWVVDGHGIASPKGGDITSRQEFGDCYLHLEFYEPVDAKGKPVTGGNSGVGMQGRYEIQILNSYGQQPEKHQCGALYDEKPPLVIASKPAGQWQTFDIIFRAPRLAADGTVLEKPRATVFQNGIMVQNNEEFTGPTGIQYGENHGMPRTGPLILQGDHDPVKFRNVWLVSIGIQ